MSNTRPALKPDVLEILLALAGGERHGYAVIEAVRERTQGSTRLNTASFYRHLARLLDAGWVAQSSDRPPDDDPRRGAYYRLTSTGRAAILAERKRLAGLLAAVDRLSPASERNPT